VLELLHLGGRSLPHAVLMMIPEAWENHEDDGPGPRAFYEFHSTFMEPWDGPACVTFTDGTLIGAVLDRNGLRPGRYWVTDDGLVVLASEPASSTSTRRRSCARAGCSRAGCSSSTPREGRIVEDDEIKGQLAAERPTRSGCTPA
jgi:glutamate synthase (NADPH/NADH) large chain